MAFDSLSEKLQNVFKNLRSKGKLTEDDVKAALKEVKMALLEADVNFKVVKQFTKSVQERAIGQDVMNRQDRQRRIDGTDGRRKYKTHHRAETSDRHHDGRSSGSR